MGRRATVALLAAFVVLSSAQAGLISMDPKWSGAAKGVCKTCIQCVDTKGEEQKACLMSCLQAAVMAVLPDMCKKVCSDSQICNGLCGKCIPCGFSKGKEAEKCLIRCVGEALVIGPVCGEVCSNVTDQSWMRSKQNCQGACTQCASCVFQEGGDAQKQCALSCVVKNLVLGPLCANACAKTSDPGNCTDVCQKVVDCAPCAMQPSEEAKRNCAINCVVGNFLFDAACKKVCKGTDKPAECTKTCLDIARTCAPCATRETEQEREQCLIKECVGSKLIGPLCNALFVGPLVQKCMQCGSCALEPAENRKACLRDCVGREGMVIDVCEQTSCDPICSGQRTEACRQRCGGMPACVDACIQDCKRECVDLCHQCGRCGYESTREAIHECTIRYCIRPFMMTPICEDYCSETRGGGIRPKNCMDVCMGCEDCIFSVDCVTRKDQVRPCLLECMFRDVCRISCENQFETPKERETCLGNCDKCKHCAKLDNTEQEGCMKACFGSLSVENECKSLCTEWGVSAGDATARCHTLCAACVRCNDAADRKGCLRNCTMSQISDYVGDLCGSVCEDQSDKATCLDRCQRCDRCPFEGSGRNVTACILARCVDSGSVSRPICEEVCANEPDKASCVAGCAACPGCVDRETRRLRLDCFSSCTAPKVLGGECDSVCQGRPNATGCRDTCRRCETCLREKGAARADCLSRCADRGQRRASCDAYCKTAREPFSCQSACMTCPQCDRLEGEALSGCIQECTKVVTAQMLADTCLDLCATYKEPDRCQAACEACTGCGPGDVECLGGCAESSVPELDFSDKEKERRDKLKKGLLSGVCDLLFGNIWDMFSCDLVCSMGGPCPIPDMRYLLKCPDMQQDNLYLYYSDLIMYFENVAAFYENMEKALDAILLGTVGMCGMCNYQLATIQGAYSSCFGIWNPTPFGAASLAWNEWMCDISAWQNCQPNTCTPASNAAYAAGAGKCPQLCTVGECHPISGMACCPCSCPPCCCPTPLTLTNLQASIDPVAMNACHSFLHEADDSCTMDGLWWRKVVETPELGNPCFVVLKITKLREYVHALRSDIIPATIAQLRAMRANARRCTVQVSCSANIKIYLDLLEETWDRANHIGGWDTKTFEEETNKFTLAMGDYMADIGSGGGGFSFDANAGVWANFKNGISVTASGYMDITAGRSFEKYMVWVPKYKNEFCPTAPVGEATSTAGQGINEIIDGAKKKAKEAATDAVKSTFGAKQIAAMTEYHSKLIALHAVNKEAGVAGIPGPVPCVGEPLFCIPSFPMAWHLVQGQNLGEDLVFNFPVLPKCGVQAFGKARPGDAFWHYHECLLYRSSTSAGAGAGGGEVFEEPEEPGGEETEEDCVRAADLAPCHGGDGRCCDGDCVPGASACTTEEEECTGMEDGERCMDGGGLCCEEMCLANATSCGTPSAECFAEADGARCSAGLCCSELCVPNATACGGATPDCIGRADGVGCGDGAGLCCRQTCIPGATACSLSAPCADGVDGLECPGGTCCDRYCVPNATSCGVSSPECGPDLGSCSGGSGLCCRGRCMPQATGCGESAEPLPDDISATCGRACEERYSSPYYCHPVRRLCACRTAAGPKLVEDVPCTPRASEATLASLARCCARHGLDDVDACYHQTSETGFCCEGAFTELPIDLSCVEDAPNATVAELAWTADGRELRSAASGRTVELVALVRNLGARLENGDLGFRVRAGSDDVLSRDLHGLAVDARAVHRATVQVPLDASLEGRTLEARAILGYLNVQVESNVSRLYVLAQDTLDVSDGFFEKSGSRADYIMPGDAVVGSAVVSSSRDEPVDVLVRVAVTANGTIVEGTRAQELVSLAPGASALVRAPVYVVPVERTGSELGLFVEVVGPDDTVLRSKRLVAEVYPDSVVRVRPPYLFLKRVSWRDEAGSLLERVYEGKRVRAEAVVSNPMPVSFSGALEVAVLDESDGVVARAVEDASVGAGALRSVRVEAFTSAISEVIALGEGGSTELRKGDKRYRVRLRAVGADGVVWADVEDRVAVLDSFVLKEGGTVDVAASSEFEGCRLAVECAACSEGCEIAVRECQPVFSLCRCSSCTFRSG